MNWLIGILVAFALILGITQAWYFFTHCANVKAIDMSGLCVLVLYNSK